MAAELVTRAVTRDDVELDELRGILIAEAQSMGIDPSAAWSYPELAKRLFIAHHATQSVLKAEHERDLDEIIEVVMRKRARG